MAHRVFNDLQTFAKRRANAALPRTFCFGPFCLDTVEHRLERDGRPVPLTPREFDVLSLLLESAGHLVSKETFLDRIWPGTAVEEANLSVQISRLRRLLDGESGAEPCIETVPKLGYRFVARVRSSRRAASCGWRARPGTRGPRRPRASLDDATGEPVRVTIQLVRLRDGETLWTEVVEGVFRNPPALQERVAEELTEILARLRPRGSS